MEIFHQMQRPSFKTPSPKAAKIALRTLVLLSALFLPSCESKAPKKSQHSAVQRTIDTRTINNVTATNPDGSILGVTIETDSAFFTTYTAWLGIRDLGYSTNLNPDDLRELAEKGFPHSVSARPILTEEGLPLMMNGKSVLLLQSVQGTPK